MTSKNDFRIVTKPLPSSSSSSASSSSSIASSSSSSSSEEQFEASPKQELQPHDTEKRKLEEKEEEEEERIRKRPSIMSSHVVEEEEDGDMEEKRRRVGRGGLGLHSHGEEEQGAEQRWRAHQMADDYITLAGNIMYPSTYLGPYAYTHTHGQYPIERLTTLGLLTNPCRRPSPIEKWSPYEIAMFEASLSLYGKVFHKVQKIVRSKTTKEIIEFYYIWKKSSHYRRWKGQYEVDIGSEESEGGGEEEEQKKGEGGAAAGGGGSGENHKEEEKKKKRRGG
mmetsp:Transcript_26663/g.39293  ORF Transcript_26663/g.39293 Transcript_26663/m.39293 type:complete len:280 (+) Transcript_26663:120-959(+)